MGANLRAPLFLSQAAAPHLKKTGGRSSISPISMPTGAQNYVIYSITKAGLAVSRARLRASSRPMCA